ncbi:NADPH-dependent FMN reductase [Marinobacter sp.]|uniref:NADPH-dependent FMN reductase n=1 Tax=Marinobacter sp. TaxID=50741 RepID=UPI00199CD0B7|nr:NADPH-dependent FMN reductase [Marinobacter sp.]MBC7191615.1 NADPH-dependent FMN reductase [Marinobacter sp.]
MHIVALLGSPNVKSRSSALAEYLLGELAKRDVEVRTYSVESFDANNLLRADFQSDQVQSYLKDVAGAAGLIVSTPVYKASISGVLKTLLDLIPEGGLQHKSVLPVASGGSPAHMLAVDHALQPVFINLKAEKALPVVFSPDSQFEKTETGDYLIGDEILQRLGVALDRFIDGFEAHPEHPLSRDRSHSLLGETLAI